MDYFWKQMTRFHLGIITTYLWTPRIAPPSYSIPFLCIPRSSPRYMDAPPSQPSAYVPLPTYTCPICLPGTSWHFYPVRILALIASLHTLLTLSYVPFSF